MSAPLTDAEIAAMKSTATDLLEAIRLDDSIAGWPEHFDDDFHEAAGPEQVLALLDALASVTTERNELLEKHERLKESYVANPEHWRSRCTMLETEIERCRAEVNAARAESEKMRQNRTGAGKRCRCCGSDFGHLRDDIDFKATTIAELRDALAAAEAKLAVIQPLLFGPESAEYYHGKHCYIGAPECFTCLRFDEVRAALSGGQQDG
jgi:DNA repair exonuclease SbcCD ATPase subunit